MIIDRIATHARIIHRFGVKWADLFHVQECLLIALRRKGLKFDVSTLANERQMRGFISRAPRSTSA